MRTGKRVDAGTELLEMEKQRNPYAAANNLKQLQKSSLGGFAIVASREEAEALSSWLGLLSVTDWEDKYNDLCRGKTVLIISLPEDQAQEIAQGLYEVTTEITILPVNVRDFISEGKTQNDFKALIDRTPGFSPQCSVIDWASPIPLTRVDNLPEFPSDVLPQIGRDMVETVSRVIQVDAGLSGSIYLGALSTCLGGKVKIDAGDHTEPCNLYLTQVSDSGERKTTTVSQMTAPIYKYQNQKAEDMKDRIREANNQHSILQKRLEKKQQDAAKEEDPIQRGKLKEEAAAISKEIAENPIPKQSVFLVDDITTEKLGTVMAENEERLSIVSAEGGIFSIMTGLYSDGKTNIDIFLKGHAGDAWSCHRMSRGSLNMAEPALTISVAVQSSVIREIGQSKMLKGRGMIARILPVFCKSMVGYRMKTGSTAAETISEYLQSRYNEHLKRLMDFPKLDKPLKLSPEALKFWTEFYNNIEIEMRPGNSLEGAKDWGSKLAGAVIRISGLLHCAEYGQQGSDQPISGETIKAATIIGAYFKEHALAMLGLMGENPKIEAAKLILEYIREHKPQTLKGRDVLRNKNAFRTMDDVQPGLIILVERGYLREFEYKDMKRRGRPEAMVYLVNPKAY